MRPMSTVDLPLLPLGRGTDLTAERGVECPGDLPAPSDPDLVARARAAKEALGERLFVLGHHYQRDEVIQFADVTGDSFKLARDAAGRPEAEYIVFCGVHFMAESADILTVADAAGDPARPRRRLLDGRHGRLAQVEDCWDALTDAGVAESVVPITYMNSSADIKAFCGRNGGAVCTSSNADVALEWAFAQKPDAKVLFLPDQHLGRNTAVLKLGMTLDDCVVWDPRQPGGGVTPEALAAARMILWKGHCSVHGRFSADVVDELRAKHPGIKILVHPECTHEVVTSADLVGSTEFIIKTIEAAPAGLELGDRHRAQPRAAARPRAPRAGHRLPRPQRLLLLDDEPDRPAPPGVGAGVPGRRRRREPDPGRPRHRAPRPGRAAADARPPRPLPPRLTPSRHRTTRRDSRPRATRRDLGASLRRLSVVFAASLRRLGVRGRGRPRGRASAGGPAPSGARPSSSSRTWISRRLSRVFGPVGAKA